MATLEDAGHLSASVYELLQACGWDSTKGLPPLDSEHEQRLSEDIYPFTSSLPTAVALAHAGSIDRLCNETHRLGGLARSLWVEVQLLRSMLESSRAREEHLVILRSQQALQEDTPPGPAPVAPAPPQPPPPQRRRGVAGGVPPPRFAPPPPPPPPAPEVAPRRSAGSSHTLHPPRAVSPPKPLVRGAGLGGGKARLESIDPSSLSNQLKDQIMGRVKLSMRRGGAGGNSSGAGAMAAAAAAVAGGGELPAKLQRQQQQLQYLHRGMPTSAPAAPPAAAPSHPYDNYSGATYSSGAPPSFHPSSSSSSAYPFSHSHGFPTASPDQRTLLRQRLFSASGGKRHSAGGGASSSGVLSPAAILASITPLPESPPPRD